MFLIRILRPLSAMAALLTPLFLASCGGLHIDDTVSVSRANGVRTRTAMALASGPGGEFAPEGMVGEPREPGKFLSLDRRVNADQAARAYTLAGDPLARPTVHERRIEKAKLDEEAKILQQGGIPRYAGNGSSSSPSSVQFVAELDALTFEYAAVPQQNAQDGTPHALTLVVYHLSDREQFDLLTRHEDGIRKLLEGERFDERTVKGVSRHSIQPGTGGSLRLDRPNHGRYVAIVAGYEKVHVTTSVSVFEYGVAQWLADDGDMDWGSTFSLKKKRKMYSPIPLHLRAHLGEHGMLVEDVDRILGTTRQLGRIMHGRVWRGY